MYGVVVCCQQVVRTALGRAEEARYFVRLGGLDTAGATPVMADLLSGFQELLLCSQLLGRDFGAFVILVTVKSKTGFKLW